MSSIKKLFFYAIAFANFSIIAKPEWTNWAGNVVCHPHQVVQPRTYKELQKIIASASQKNMRVHAVGTGHSWQNILCTDGILINTDNLNRVLSVDNNKKQVRVEAGIKLEQLVNALDDHGLAFPNLPSVTVQSIAGAASTATHGTGHTGTLASFVVGVSLLTADGKLHEISLDKNSKWFPAARMSIGCLGVVYAVTLQCVSAFKLRHHNYRTNWQTMREQYQTLQKENDYFTFFADFTQDRIIVDTFNRTNDPHIDSMWYQTKKLLYVQTLGLLRWLSKYFPQLFLHAVNWWAAYGKDYEQVEYSYEALAGPPSPYYLEEEIAVSPDILFEVLDAIKRLVLSYKEKGLTIYGTVCRFVASEENILLSPAAQKDVVFLSVTSPVELSYEPFYRDLFNLMMKFEGRPHWGKMNFLTQELCKQLYGKNFDEFIAVRKELDPSGMFSNDFTKHIFGW